jgi:hypothetical protein
MTDKRVWFITGAGRGMGVDFAKAALAPRRPLRTTPTVTPSGCGGTRA